MFILIDKKNSRAYASESKKELSNKSGINYHTLGYYARKVFYENLDIIFARVESLKSKQGGKRDVKAT